MVSPRPSDIWESGKNEFGSLGVFTTDPTTLPETLRSTLVLWLEVSHRLGVVGVVGASATARSVFIAGGDFSPRLYRPDCLAQGLEFVTSVLEVVEQMASSREGVIGVGGSRRHIERKLSVYPDIKIANRDVRIGMVAGKIKKRIRNVPIGLSNDPQVLWAVMLRLIILEREEERPVCSGRFQTKWLAVHNNVRVAEFLRIFLGLWMRKKVSIVLYLPVRAPGMEGRKQNATEADVRWSTFIDEPQSNEALQKHK